MVADESGVPRAAESALTVQNERLLTAAEFQRLENVPPEEEWLANITNKNTRTAYRKDVEQFARFVGIFRSEDFRKVKRPHLIAWRKLLESRSLETATIRRKLSAVASLFDFLCECNAVPFNPADGVKRPSAGINEGKSPALSDEQAAALLGAPPGETLKGRRDRAILSVLLFHALRRAEVCALNVGDVEARKGVMHFRVHGKGGKIRYVPVHAHTLGCIADYLEVAGHGLDSGSPLFKPLKNPATGNVNGPLTGNGVYKQVVKKYASIAGISAASVTVHGLRATAATNALDHQADIAKVQQWLGHANIATTRLYDRRGMKPEESPTYKVDYRN